jgi:hypothetical protein
LKVAAIKNETNLKLGVGQSLEINIIKASFENSCLSTGESSHQAFKKAHYENKKKFKKAFKKIFKALQSFNNPSFKFLRSIKTFENMTKKKFVRPSFRTRLKIQKN